MSNSNNKTTNASAIGDSEECTRLKLFRNFLKKLAGGEVNGPGANNGNNITAAEIRMTRRDTDSYPVSFEEFEAEVVMTIWLQLQTKHCPCDFQLALLKAVQQIVQQERRNSKECDFIYVTRKSTVEEVAAAMTQYDSGKLQKFVSNTLEKLLMRLNDNTEAGNLRNYAEPGALCDDAECQCDQDQEVLKKKSPLYVSGQVKNKPRKMEDRHVCLERFSDLYKLDKKDHIKMSFFGVFDGHSGPLAASYTASQLPFLLAEHLKHCEHSELAIREAFEASFLQADKMFAQKRISSGTTAVCALLRQPKAEYGPTHLYVAWVGDSKALLVGSKATLQLVKPHKPDAAEELQRIEATGGSVLFVQGQWRVNGVLNVARSIGDYSVRGVIAEPDFVDVEITQAHDFLVLGTDGLWDHVPESEIVQTIYSALLDGNNSCSDGDCQRTIEDIPKTLIELAKQGDSQDNITVVIVFLKDYKEIIANYRKE